MKHLQKIDARIAREISRRNLFRYLGNAAIALPFMRTLLESQAFGEVARKRTVIFFYPNGIARGSFHPDATGSDFVLKQSTANLERIRKDIIIMNNLNYNLTGTHEDGLQYCLTGTAGRQKTVSIDTVLGERMKANASIPVLRLGTGAGTHEQPEMRFLSYYAVGKPSQIENNPSRSFQNLFGAEPGSTPAASKGLAAAGRKSIIDASLNELKRLQANMGAQEKAKLDLHVAAIREIERRLQNASEMVVNASCTKTIKSKRSFPLDKNEHLTTGNFIDVLDMNNEIALQAMACGVSNVVFIQNSSAGSYVRHDQAGAPSENGEDAHEHAHHNPARHAINTNFYMGKFADLVSAMGALKEGDKSILYNSTVMALSEFADGVQHDQKGVGVVLAGQAGGFWGTGRCVDVSGASHNRVLVTILQSMGFNDESFGDAKLGTGPLNILRAAG